MTRVFVQRGSTSGSSSNTSRGTPSPSSTLPSSSTPRTDIQSPGFSRVEDVTPEVPEVAVNEDLEACDSSENMVSKSDDVVIDSSSCSQNENLGGDAAASEKHCNFTDSVGSVELPKDLGESRMTERLPADNEGSRSDTSPAIGQSAYPPPPPPPVPPPQPLATLSNSRGVVPGSPNSVRMGPSRRGVTWPVSSTRTSPTASRPSSPRSHSENEGYNSSDEQNVCLSTSYSDLEREREFEIDLRRTKGLEVRRMLDDGNCLFRAVADQVYGDSDYYDMTRQMCIDYMEQNRDHFSQFITEGFTSYCKRKRRDKVYGNNVEIQALSEMYNRPIHIYSYSTEPINIFHGSYHTETPPVRLSYHQGNHYNSLVDPRSPTIGAGLGFSSLRGRDVDKDQVKAAIKAQQDQQIDNALIAQGRFFSDLELTEKEMERAVMEVSRSEYLAGGTHKHTAESSSSGTRPSGSEANELGSIEEEYGTKETVINNTMQLVLSMGFSYTQVIEAYSIFGDDVDSMVCYLLEMGSGSSRSKGKAAK